MQLQDKKIILTGGASGIGAATAKAYLAEGAAVAVVDVNDGAAQSMLGGLSSGHAAKCRYYNCDISDREQVFGTFESAQDWLGGLDVMANIGAIITYRKAENFTDAEWQRIFAVNTQGTMLTNQAAFKYMRESGGCIINVGSMSGMRPHPGNAAYSATKGAVMAWSRSVAAEWGQYNIRVNSLAPVAQTPMADIPTAGMSEDEHKRSIQGLVQQIPLGRIGSPERDIAPVMVFLASDASHYMTGQVLSVDGGGFAMLGS